MNLLFHELIHIVLSMLVGFLIWKYLFKNINVFLIAFLGGVLIDLDHLFDYFLAFGAKFNLTYFAKGYQFLKSDKIYIPLHSWEIVIICFLLFLFFAKLKKLITLRILLLAFSLSLFSHLIFDTISNELPMSSYSFIKRANANFELKQLVFPDHYQKHLEEQKNNKMF